MAWAYDEEIKNDSSISNDENELKNQNIDRFNTTKNLIRSHTYNLKV